MNAPNVNVEMSKRPGKELTLNRPLLLQVSAKMKWQGTGLFFNPEEVVAIRYEGGKWSACPGHWHDANGWLEGKTGASWVKPEVTYGALCAKIGNNGSARLVGNASYFMADCEGELMLIINDDFTGQYGPGFDDNLGAISVWVWRTSVQDAV